MQIGCFQHLCRILEVETAFVDWTRCAVVRKLETISVDQIMPLFGDIVTKLNFDVDLATIWSDIASEKSKKLDQLALVIGPHFGVNPLVYSKLMARVAVNLGSSPPSKSPTSANMDQARIHNASRLEFLWDSLDNDEKPRQKNRDSNNGPTCSSALASPAPPNPNFTLIISESESIRCHDWVLYSVWPYFRSLLEAGLAETQSRSAQLPCETLSPKSWKLLLRYMYTGSMEDMDSTVLFEILKESEFLQLMQAGKPSEPWFAPLIDAAFVHGLSIHNTVECYRIARQLQMDEQMERIFDLICSQFAQIGKLSEAKSCELHELFIEFDLYPAAMWKVHGFQKVPLCGD